MVAHHAGPLHHVQLCLPGSRELLVRGRGRHRQGPRHLGQHGVAHRRAVLPGLLRRARFPARSTPNGAARSVIVFWCLILWGVLSAMTGVVSNIPALMAVRFLLGVVEAAVFPALVIFVSRWFARSERSLANSFITLSTPVTVLWMSIVSGYLVQAYGWRWMFIIEGVPASLWAIGWWYLVQDRPAQASWLDPQRPRDPRSAGLPRSNRASRPSATMARRFDRRRSFACRCSISSGA